MEKRQKTFNKSGMYAGYDKKHKERDNLDYYSTPEGEILNILNELNIDFNDNVILEPCCGGGHMVRDILKYISEKESSACVIATDIKDRGFREDKLNCLEYGLDFFADDYAEHLPVDVDYIIMNPPYSTIEPFVMKALGLANKGILMLGRLQFLEGQSRYENILKDFPPSDVYVYVDRISCDKNGTEKMGAVQAYRVVLLGFN